MFLTFLGPPTHLFDDVILFRAVARSENPGGHIVLGGDNVPPLVEIGLTDLSKSGGGGHRPPACDRPESAFGICIKNHTLLN